MKDERGRARRTVCSDHESQIRPDMSRESRRSQTTTRAAVSRRPRTRQSRSTRRRRIANFPDRFIYIRTQRACHDPLSVCVCIFDAIVSRLPGRESSKARPPASEFVHATLASSPCARWTWSLPLFDVSPATDRGRRATPSLLTAGRVSLLRGRDAPHKRAGKNCAAITAESRNP